MSMGSSKELPSTNMSSSEELCQTKRITQNEDNSIYMGPSNEMYLIQRCSSRGSYRSSPNELPATEKSSKKKLSKSRSTMEMYSALRRSTKDLFSHRSSSKRLHSFRKSSNEISTSKELSSTYMSPSQDMFIPGRSSKSSTYRRASMENTCSGGPAR